MVREKPPVQIRLLATKKDFFMIHSIQLALKAFEPLVLKRVTHTFQTFSQRMQRGDFSGLYKPTPKTTKQCLQSSFKQRLGSCVSVGLPTKTKKFTVLRSPHVNKKSREQFEVQTLKTLLAGVANVPFAHRKNMLSSLKHKGFSGTQARCTVMYATSLSGMSL